MSMRGKTAIVGIGEVPTRREYPERSMWGLCAQAAREAILDSGIRKEDIDGLITEGGSVFPSIMSDHLGIQPRYAAGVSMMGASTGAAVSTAAAVIEAGLAKNVLVVMGQGRQPNEPFMGGGGLDLGAGSEWEFPWGPAAAANTGYGVMYRRHMHEYGTTEEQLAHISVNQRFNALLNENAVFRGQPITHEDVMKSRYINYPLKLLECVMPCGGAAACVVTSAEHAKALPNPRVNILGMGVALFQSTYWLNERELTTTPVRISGPAALEMAGYSGKDMQFAEFYD